MKRVLVGYGIDLDAISGWINTRNGSPASPTDVSRGVFGATCGTDRLLQLWEKYNIRTTWFVPAHTAVSFPEAVRKVRDAGHEIALHGWTHEYVTTLGEDQQREVLRESIKVLTQLCGRKPKGWTAPGFEASRQTVQLLEEFGLEYDHSFMYHDALPYWLPYTPTWKETTMMAADRDGDGDPVTPSTWMEGMSELKPSSIVEIPANWHLDDWPPFQLNLKQASTHGFVDPYVVERMWKDQFDYYYREYDQFIFPISIHPQVSGKAHIMLMHERLINYINGHSGVEWCTMAEMNREFREGRLAGTTVCGGVPVTEAPGTMA
ncbi:Peptidoglycan deacetylase [Fonsecaea pedrosoi]|nr:Peptidoglycan deacetylase [Fonsecaea pedrosoi]